MDKLKIGILHVPNTLNYGSMMLCENAIYYLSKIIRNVSFVVLGPNETRILQGDDLLREYESIMASRAQSWWLGRFCLVFLTFGIVVILGIGVWCRRRSADRNSHMSAR